MICHSCELIQNSHSFIHLYTYNGIHVLYSCPSIAIKYYDTPGILLHFENLLNYYKCDEHYWEWHFDFEGFGIKHMLEINTAIGICKLINKYSNYLLKIKIVNTNFFTDKMVKIVTPFLNENVKNKIET